jgi:hypothetical protein
MTMAKQGGMGQKLFVDGMDISGDIQTYTLSGGRAPLTGTAIVHSGEARIFGRRDGQASAVTYFNPGAFDSGDAEETGSHRLLRALPLTDRVLTIADPQSGQAWSIVGKQGSYDPTRAADGSLTCAVQVLGNGYGLEHGDLLTTAGSVSITGAASTTAVDFGAASAFGAQAYLQVTEFTGTDATIAVQSSSDNGGADAFANVTGLVFTQVTADPTTERLETGRAAAIERYLRVNVTTTGGFSSLTYVVMVVRNEETVNF